MGTAVHAGIEAKLSSDLGEDHHDIDDAIERAFLTWQAITEMENFRYIQVTEPTALRFIEKAMRAWHAELYPQLTPRHVELEFGPYVLHEDDHRVIQVKGTIDLVDEHLGLWDWKTASRAYEAWEYQRYGIQPTVYTWAYRQFDPEHAGTLPMDFTFGVIVRPSAAVQTLTVTRHAGDHEWLRRKAVAAARLIEAELPEWPLSDASWACSPKWCPAWDTCRGLNYADGWPETNAPR